MVSSCPVLIAGEGPSTSRRVACQLYSGGAVERALEPRDMRRSKIRIKTTRPTAPPVAGAILAYRYQLCANNMESQAGYGIGAGWVNNLLSLACQNSDIGATDFVERTGP